MLNIFKMDLRRLLHSKVFYVAIAFFAVMAIAMVQTGMGTSVSALLGVVDGGMGEDFMNASMGTGVIFVFLGIILTRFICGDYAGGFAKNIFTSHADTKDYIGGRMLSMGLTSAFMLIFYTVLSLVVLSISGYGVVLPGGVGGLLAFLIQKWVVSLAFIALIMLVNLFTRNTAAGIIAGFLVATGGLSMGFVLFAQMINMDSLGRISDFLISGVSQMATLTFSASTFFQIVAVSAVWLVACYLGGRKVLKTKDV